VEPDESTPVARLMLFPTGTTAKVRRPDGTWAEMPMHPRWTYEMDSEGN
jgi:hypothetical protein